LADALGAEDWSEKHPMYQATKPPNSQKVGIGSCIRHAVAVLQFADAINILKQCPVHLSVAVSPTEAVVRLDLVKPLA
jgi:hypothetical protein